ncbi:MAG: hypothetical protein ACLS4Z_08535 [Christensenellaceae bacterium]
MYGDFQAGETADGKTPLTDYTEGDAEPSTAVCAEDKHAKISKENLNGLYRKLSAAMPLYMPLKGGRSQLRPLDGRRGKLCRNA